MRSFQNPDGLVMRFTTPDQFKTDGWFMTIYGVYNIQLFGDLLAENLYKKNMFTRILSRND